MRLWLALAISVWLASCVEGPTRAPVSQHVMRPMPASGDHRVVRGETLYGIAWQYQLDGDDLAAWNGIGPPYTIYPGQRLRLTPPPSDTAPVIAPQPAPSPPPLPSTTPAQPVVTLQASRPKFAAAPPRSAPAIPANVQASRPKTNLPIPAAGGPPETIATAPSAAPPPPAPPPPPEHRFLDNPLWTWPARGALLRRYDASSPGKKGISIAGNAGDDVLAAAAGKVVYAGSGLSGYGRLIIIKHNQQYLSAYAHNKELLAREGDWVDAGQLIAHMGSSGTNRTQLYFEIRKNQISVDPLTILPNR